MMYRQLKRAVSLLLILTLLMGTAPVVSAAEEGAPLAEATVADIPDVTPPPTSESISTSEPTTPPAPTEEPTPEPVSSVEPEENEEPTPAPTVTDVEVPEPEATGAPAPSTELVQGWVEIAQDASLVAYPGDAAFATVSGGIGYAPTQQNPEETGCLLVALRRRTQCKPPIFRHRNCGF